MATITIPERTNASIDFRSDTVTKPTVGMYQAMVTADLGDDVFGDDPTVISLENKVALLTGKEAGLFFPTGVMANQVALMVNVHNAIASGGVVFPEIICDSRSHVYVWECGGIAFHARASVRCVKETAGYLTPEVIAGGLQLPSDPVLEVHQTRSCVLSLENPLGGKIMPFDVFKANCDLARQHKLLIHLDGARLWNLTAGKPELMKDICGLVDTISLCLSKGLGTPCGSVVTGTKADIHLARMFRKRMGGGMRQSGVMAAAGIWAIDNIWHNQMPIDHENARYLAHELQSLGWDVVPPDTNILMVDTKSNIITFDFLKEKLAPHNIVLAGGGRGRLVLHHGITRAQCETFVKHVKQLVEEESKRT